MTSEDVIAELRRRGIVIDEELLALIDGLYAKGFTDGFERGAYEEMTQEDVECEPKKS